MVFNELTPEQRAEALAKAQQARAEQTAFNKANEHTMEEVWKMCMGEDYK